MNLLTMLPRKESKILYTLAVGLQLSFSIAAPIGILTFLGYWLDESFHTSPLWTLIGIFIGIAVTAYELYNVLKRLNGEKNK